MWDEPFDHTSTSMKIMCFIPSADVQKGSCANKLQNLLSVWRSHEYSWLSVHSTKHLTEIYWRPAVPQQTMLDHFVIQTENNIFYQRYQQVSYVSSQIKTICWSGQWSGSWSWDKRTQSKPPLFRTTSVEGKVIDRNSVPLKFEDIVDKKIYDKMRPPKPGGKICIHNINYLV